MMKEFTTIRLSKETKARLDALLYLHETYEQLLTRILQYLPAELKELLKEREGVQP